MLKKLLNEIIDLKMEMYDITWRRISDSDKIMIKSCTGDVVFQITEDLGRINLSVWLYGDHIVELVEWENIDTLKTIMIQYNMRSHEVLNTMGAF